MGEDGLRYMVEDYGAVGDGRTKNTAAIQRAIAECHANGGVLTGPVSQVEQFILVSTECHGYRTEDKSCDLLNEAVLPDYSEVDHVRVFDDLDMQSAAPCAASQAASDHGTDKPVYMF